MLRAKLDKYAILASPLFDLTPFNVFADDNQIIESGNDLEQL